MWLFLDLMGKWNKIFKARLPVNNCWNNRLPRIIAFSRTESLPFCGKKEIITPGYYSRKYGIQNCSTGQLHSRPQSPLGAWARGPGGSGNTRDTAFEVLDFRTSGHFRFKWKLEDFLLKALNHLNLQSMTLGQEQVTAIRNVVKNQKWPEVLKSWTSNPVSPKPPGTRTLGTRKGQL